MLKALIFFVFGFLSLFNLLDTAFKFEYTLFLIRRINGHSIRLELNFFLKLLSEIPDTLTKEKYYKLKFDSYV